MKISQHFSLSEFTTSTTASNLNIDNTPTEQITDNITELTTTILEPFRTYINTPIRITSGYISQQLNIAVKGSTTSAHLTGYAVDIKPINCPMLRFQSELINWLKETNTPFDQVILEKLKSNGEATWIHIALKSNTGKQRRQIFTQ